MFNNIARCQNFVELNAYNFNFIGESLLIIIQENMESLPIGENLAEEDEADLTNLYSGNYHLLI